MTQFDASKPIYQQIIDHYYQQICSEQLPLGSKLPSVRETAVLMAVNPNTVSRAYMEMEREHIVFSKRGQGTFVTEEAALVTSLRHQLAQQQTTMFIQAMKKIGFTRLDILTLLQQQLEEEGE